MIPELPIDNEQIDDNIEMLDCLGVSIYDYLELHGGIQL